MNNQNIRNACDKLGRVVTIKQITFHKKTATGQHVAMIEDILKHAMLKIQLAYDVTYPADEFSDKEVEAWTHCTRIILQRYGLTRLN